MIRWGVKSSQWVAQWVALFRYPATFRGGANAHWNHHKYTPARSPITPQCGSHSSLITGRRSQMCKCRPRKGGQRQCAARNSYFVLPRVVHSWHQPSCFCRAMAQPGSRCRAVAEAAAGVPAPPAEVSRWAVHPATMPLSPFGKKQRPVLNAMLLVQERDVVGSGGRSGGGRRRPRRRRRQGL